MTQGATVNGERLMDSDETAAYLGRTRAWLHDVHVKLGIPSYTVGRKIMFRQGELDQWLADQCRRTPANRGEASSQ